MSRRSAVGISRKALRELKREVMPIVGNGTIRRLYREAGRDGIEDWEYVEGAIEALMDLSDDYFAGKLYRGFTYRPSKSGQSVWIGLKEFESPKPSFKQE